MRKSYIEKRLKKAITNSVPDVLDNILQNCEDRKGDEFNMEVLKKEKRFRGSKLVGVLATAMICICGVFGFNQYNSNYKVDSIIEFDVNPSIELNVNKNERVIEVSALNEEGAKVLDGMDLKNVDLDVAVNAIIGGMLKNGYVTVEANSILVSVKNDDAEKGNMLQERISSEITEILKASSIDGSILTQSYENDEEIKKIANENDLSEGKVELVNKIIAAGLKDKKGKAYTFETLSKLSINELNLLLSSKEVKLEQVNSTGTVSEKSYIGKEKAKQIALKNAKVSEDKVKDLEIELDYENGKMVYEVGFDVGNKEYDYEIDAKSGKIIRGETEVDDDIKETAKKDKNTTTSNTKKDTQKSDLKVNNEKKKNTTSSTKKDSDKTTTTSNKTENVIGKEKAKQIAFNHAKVSTGDIKDLEVELDNDDGITVYEISFQVKNKEYDYEINAISGKVIKAESEIDD